MKYNNLLRSQSISVFFKPQNPLKGRKLSQDGPLLVIVKSSSANSTYRGHLPQYTHLIPFMCFRPFVSENLYQFFKYNTLEPTTYNDQQLDADPAGSYVPRFSWADGWAPFVMFPLHPTRRGVVSGPRRMTR